MILINNEILIKNERDLNDFFGFLSQECYNKQTEELKDVIMDFLLDVWDRVEKIDIMVKKKISEDISSVALVNIEETEDLRQTEIIAVSKTNDFKVGEKEKVIFNGIVEHYFTGIKSLYDRFVELE